MRRLSFTRWLHIATLVGVGAVACAADPSAPSRATTQVGQPLLSAGADDSTSAEPAPARTRTLGDSTAAGAGNQNDRVGFGTRYAYFAPAGWNELPGWDADRLGDAWTAFRRSCAALGGKTAWSDLCARAKALGTANDEAVRKFFEREFVLYEIRNTDRTPEGVITGYYEPLINGSRSKGGVFVYPVYAKPDDLLTLDVRRVPRELRGKPVAAHIEGHTVVPVPGGDAPYVIDVGDLQSDVRDKKLRVRLEGTRIVPYPTRAQIEQQGLPRARVLAWVDNPAGFYSMQIQGAGKVRLPGGQIVRLAYAEQNGQPFRPPVAKRGGGAKKSRITTRGLDIELPEGEEDPVDETDPAPGLEPQDDEPLTRGLRSEGAGRSVAGGAAVRARPRPGEPLSPEVERLIEELATGGQIGGAQAPGRPKTSAGPASGGAAPAGRPAATAKSAPAASPSVGGSPAIAAPDDRGASGSAAVVNFPQPSDAVRAAISADPSYVFFREIPDGPEGPIGALGVPLTAGRSVAVDPRTTPLGFPVFVSTTRPGREGRLNRLVMAQDTGGAIRGAVRADYFWGFGAEAYRQAARMKENGRMWLLLPSDQEIVARDQAVRTRGAGSGANFECVVSDPELCVEDP